MQTLWRGSCGREKWNSKSSNLEWQRGCKITAEMLCIMIIVLGWLGWPALIGSLITLPRVNKLQKITAVRTLGWLGGLGYNSTGIAQLICTGPPFQFSGVDHYCGSSRLGRSIHCCLAQCTQNYHSLKMVIDITGIIHGIYMLIFASDERTWWHPWKMSFGSWLHK